MKIINKKEFLSLPGGVLYSVYEPCAFFGLYVKGETWDRDYIEMDLVGNIEADNSVDHTDKLMEAEERGTSLNLDFEDWTRNGLFEDDTLYAVYEQEDLDKLINFLKTCKGYECTK